MAEEIVLIKIEIDQATAVKELEQTEKNIINLRDAQSELNKELKDGKIDQDGYVKSKVELDQQMRKEQNSRKTLTQVINTESNSLDAQKRKLSDLIKERNATDRSTESGVKKFNSLNKEIKGLNDSIGEAEQAGGSFQRNVGNYAGALDQFGVGATGALNAIKGMTTASLAFIATPIGAIIGAIGIAVAALSAYFKGSEEGQNKWNKIMNVGSEILDKFGDMLKFVGGLLVAAFENPKQAAIDLFNFVKDNIINRFTAFAVILEGITELDFKKVANGIIQAGTGVENVIDKVQDFGKTVVAELEDGIEAGQKMADLQAEIDKQERQLLQERARIRLEVAKLRQKADESEGKSRRKFIEEAIALELKLSAQEVASAQTRQELAEIKGEQADADKEELQALAEANAALADAESAAFENTRKLNKERLDLIKKEKEEFDKFTAFYAASLEKSNNLDQSRLKKQIDFAIQRAGIQKEADDAFAISAALLNQKIIDENIKAQDALTGYLKISSELRKIIYSEEFQKFKEALDATLQFAKDIFAGITESRRHEAEVQLNSVSAWEHEQLKELQDKLKQGLISEKEYASGKTAIQEAAKIEEDKIKEKAFNADKKNRIIQSTVDMVQSALAAFRALVGVPIVGPILAAAAAIAATAFGIKQIALIKKEQYVPQGGFSEGGYTGKGHRLQPAGIVHRDEYVVPSWQVHNPIYTPHLNALEFGRVKGYADGGLVTSTAVSSIDQRIEQINTARLQADRPVIASFREFVDLQNRIKIKENVTTA